MPHNDKPLIDTKTGARERARQWTDCTVTIVRAAGCSVSGPTVSSVAVRL